MLTLRFARARMIELHLQIERRPLAARLTKPQKRVALLGLFFTLKFTNNLKLRY